MSKRGKYLPDKGGGRQIKVYGVACAFCGERFNGTMAEATRRCIVHYREDHPGEYPEYVAVVEPLTSDAHDKLRQVGTVDQLVEEKRAIRLQRAAWEEEKPEHG